MAVRTVARVNEHWDPAKARANLRKHGVSFREASTIERDPMLLVTEDRTHSTDERRWTGIGLSNLGRMLWVTYTYRGLTMRPITARRATKRERNEYFSRTR